MEADFKSFNFVLLFFIFDHGKGVKLDFNECVFLFVCPSVGWSVAPSVTLWRGVQRRAGKQLISCIQTYVLFVLVYNLMGAGKTAKRKLKQQNLS